MTVAIFVINFFIWSCIINTRVFTYLPRMMTHVLIVSASIQVWADRRFFSPLKQLCHLKDWQIDDKGKVVLVPKWHMKVYWYTIISNGEHWC